MSYGDFGNFGSWTPRDQSLNKMVFNKAYKGRGSGGGGGGGGNNNNTGCTVILTIIVGIILIILFSR